MKKILTLVAAIMAVSASTAMAGGVNIGWSDCFAGLSSSNVTNACTANSPIVGTAWVSVIPIVGMTQVVSTTVVVDIQVGTATLPLWWSLQGGGCRAGAGVMDYAATFAAITCPSIFEGTTDTTIPAATNGDVIGVGNVQAGVGGANRIRFVSVGAVQQSLAASINTLTEYAVVKFALTRAKSVGTGACAGCNVGAAIVVNEVTIQQPLGLGDQRVTNAADRQGITYSSSAAGAVAPPAVGATATNSRTWGAVKALYR